jgi:hypothetical protein
MALLTDDCDYNDIYMVTSLGGNGDYYISLIDKKDNLRKTIRVSTSGGNAPTEVKIAVANLYRAMEAAGLNECL